MVDKFLSALFQLPRMQKRAAQALSDAICLGLGFFLAMSLRLESLSFTNDHRIWTVIGLVIVLSIGLFFRLNLYAAMVRYISTNAVVSIALGVICSALLLFPANAAFGGIIPRTVPAIYAIIAFLLITGTRFAIRAIFNQRQNFRKENVFIYGAGSAGRQLLRTLQQDAAFDPIAFLDDSPQLQNVSVAGLRVHSPDDLVSLVHKFGTRHVLLAIPSATPHQRRDILARLGQHRVHVQTIPGIADILSGKAQINELRNVAVEDLLGRATVPPLDRLLDANLRDKSVMVTGAGGSIGSELCRQAITCCPKRLVLVETSEFALYSIDVELRRITAELGTDIEIVPLLMSVQSQSSMTMAMRRFQIETVYHAAAYKHVPLVEHNVVESIRNNVFGTQATAMAAIETGVTSFILVSTDKAVRPTNFMGATKRMAELICQALAKEQGTTRFSMVRFGNVLGSSGSVIPHFRQQIETGGPVTVTHPEVTRYFMTIPEAALLVLQAGAMAKGGDVFVLDMGDPVAIVDLAMRMVRLSGLTPYFLDDERDGGLKGDIAITFTQLRPGEKLYEELLIGESVTPTQHPSIMAAHEEMMPWAELQNVLAHLNDACNHLNLHAIRELMITAPLAFAPAADFVDLSWANRSNEDVISRRDDHRMSAAE